MENNFSALILFIFIATPAFAHQFSPTPEAGLWRHESRELVDNADHQKIFDDVAVPLSHTTAEQRTQLAKAINEANPIINMECFTLSQVGELVQIDSLQREMQRKVPECELTAQPLDRSTLSLHGNCKANHGFHGKVHGYVEFITSHQFQITFLGEAQIPAETFVEADSPTPEARLHRNETYRWSAADCGDLQPQERLSF